MFKGIITALVTPFLEGGEIDNEFLGHLLNAQIKANISAIIISGSTGEGLSLNAKEYADLIKAAKNIVQDKAKIIAGISSFNLSYAKDMVIAASEYADGLLCTSPIYTKPCQRGIYEYYKEIAVITKLPIMLYSVPSRTGADIENKTIKELSEIDNINAFKDASGCPARSLELSRYIDVFSGDDIDMLSFYANAAIGTVSVASNIVPNLCNEVYRLYQSGNIDAAQKLHLFLTPLYRNLSPNPVMIKFFLSQMGMCKNILRLPLMPYNGAITSELKTILDEENLYSQ